MAQKTAARKGKAKQHQPSPGSPGDSLPLVNPSSQTPFPPNFFRSPNFESRFHNNIIHKQCVYEKSVDQIIFIYSPLHPLFESCGLSAILFPPNLVYPRLVHQFYANFEIRDNTCTSLVKGQPLSFSSTDFG